MPHEDPARSWRAWRATDGKIRPFRGVLPLVDRGFRYGQHVFESIAIRGGAALLVEEHLLLLSTSATRQGIPCSRVLLAKLRSFLISRATGDGMLRIYLTAGPGAPGSEVTAPGCYLTWEPAVFPTFADLERGFTLVSVAKPFLGEHWGIKSGNYAPHLEALREAHAAGADEAIVRDGRGKILSCAMGNLLVWMPGTGTGKPSLLCTPPTGQAVRAGAVLEWVRRETPVAEREFLSADLSRALALALTNSRLGVMPVTTLEGRNLPSPSLAVILAREYLRKVIS